MSVFHLTLTGLPAELDHGFVDQAHPMGAAVGKLAAVGVQRYHAVTGDGLAVVEEVFRLADAAEAERLQPGKAVEREAVVQLGDVDVLGPQ